MLSKKAIITLAFLLHGAWTLRADTSITAIGQSADVVMIGTLTNLGSGPSNGQFTFTLGVTKVLKGQINTPSITATLISGGGYIPPSVIPTSSIGQVGIWFLTQSQDNYQLIPTQTGHFLPGDLSWPLTPSLATLNFPGTLEQHLLQYLIGWYQSLANPSTRDDMRCVESLQSPSTIPQDALSAANSLMGSLVVADQVIGFAAAIGLGSDDALTSLSASVEVLASSPKFYIITDALSILYHPHGAASVPILKRIIDLHSSAPEIDAAAGAALSKIVVKEALPAMAELLNSSDPTAQLRAASFFGLFTLFADQNGIVSGGGPTGPFATDQTRQYTPRANSGITPQAYSSFWQEWWAQNHALFGF